MVGQDEPAVNFGRFDMRREATYPTKWPGEG
jgi:hypothetical protein